MYIHVTYLRSTMILNIQLIALNWPVHAPIEKLYYSILF